MNTTIAINITTAMTATITITSNITAITSGVVVKTVLPRWQKGVRGRGAVLGGMMWATPPVLASKMFRFSLPLIQQLCVVGSKAEGLSQFIYSFILRLLARI